MNLNRLLKIFISIFYLTWLLVKNFVKKYLLGKNDNRFLILYYHSIPDNLKDNFIWQLKTLSRFGKFVDIDFKVKERMSGRYYSISFDDGFRSVLKNAIPELEKRNIPYTIFFPTSYIGKEPAWNVYGEAIQNNECVITEEEIQSLNKSLVKIGSHTVNHPKLTQIPAEKQEFELKESKKHLEKLWDSNIDFLSVPYGDYNSELIKRSDAAGYKILFSTDPKYVSTNGVHYDVRGRVAVGPGNSKLEFIIKILGGYNWVSDFIELKRKLKKVSNNAPINQEEVIPANYFVKEITDESTWHSLLKEFSDANIYQTWNFSALAQGEKKVKHYAIYNKESAVGMAQVRFKTAPIINRGIAYIFRGPVWQKKNQENNKEIFINVMKALRDELVVNKKYLLRLRPFIFTDQFSDIDFLEKVGFEKRDKFRPYHTLTLNLEQDMEEIKKGFNRKWRNCLNQSLKKDLQVKEGYDPSLFEDLLKTYNQMAQRKKFKQFVDIEKMGRMNNALDDELKLKIYIVYENKKPVASFAASSIGDTALAMFGGSTKEGLKNKSTYLIQWKAIDWFKEEGCKKYDLGGIDLKLNPNGYIFKSGITKNEVFGMGAFEACESFLSKFIVRLGEKFYKK